MNTRAKYWVAVLYPESMVENWQEKIYDLLQVPFSYCIHDKDLDNDNESRKVHIHLILAFSNTTTYNHALKVYQKLQPSCSICKQVINIRYMYNYLIHDTESCKKSNKHKYSIEERINGNNFDIGSYEQISLEEKRKMVIELADFIVNNNIMNFSDFYIFAIQKFDICYQEVIISYSGFLERLTKGNYLKGDK